MDANDVVGELVHYGIIPESVQEDISHTSSPKRRNEILHAGLKKTCTKDTLMRACEIIIAVKGNPKMSALGSDMKRRLETGMYCVCAFVCVNAQSMPELCSDLSLL